MANKTERLTDLKCRDCLHFVLLGWWDPQHACEITGFPVDENNPACVSVLPKNFQYYPKTQNIKGDGIL